jgi:hypothetical protein
MKLNFWKGDKTMPVAIDPLHQILRDDIYVKLVELRHPHVPLIKTLEEVLKTVPAAERKAIQARANAVASLANAVNEAMPASKGKTIRG